MNNYWLVRGGDGSEMIGRWDEVLDVAESLKSRGIGWVIAGIEVGNAIEPTELMPEWSVRDANAEVRAMSESRDR